MPSPKADIGYLHVIDYYMYQAVKDIKPRFPNQAEIEFDISTEQNEGWAYAKD